MISTIADNILMSALNEKKRKSHLTITKVNCYFKDTHYEVLERLTKQLPAGSKGNNNGLKELA